METEIRAVLTGRIARFGPKGEPSGYRKAVRADRVTVTMVGLSDDEQADLVHHGAVDKAVHHYAIDHHEAWVAEQPALAGALDGPGAFGENVATLGWKEDDVCIGDRFRMGTALVEISQGRQPCWKLGHHFGDPAMVGRVVETGRCGWYYRVIEPGAIMAGDRIRLLDRRYPEWTVARTFRILIGKVPTSRSDIADLAGLPQLSRSWRARCHAMLG